MSLRSDELHTQDVPVLRRGHQQRWLYADDVVRMNDETIAIRRYYWPRGRKRIDYRDIREQKTRTLTAWKGQYRLHGMDLRGRWYSRDRNRAEKDLAIDLDVGKRIRPVITPDDPTQVLEILNQRTATSTGGSEPE